jgi:hypothetical protein
MPYSETKIAEMYPELKLGGKFFIFVPFTSLSIANADRSPGHRSLLLDL